MTGLSGYLSSRFLIQSADHPIKMMTCTLSMRAPIPNAIELSVTGR